MMTHPQMLKLVRTIMESESLDQSALADKLKVTKGFVSRVLAGKRPASDAFLAYFGLERVEAFQITHQKPARTRQDRAGRTR